MTKNEIKEYLSRIPYVYGYSLSDSINEVEEIIMKAYENGEDKLGESYFKLFREKYEELEMRRSELENTLRSFNKIVEMIKGV